MLEIFSTNSKNSINQYFRKKRFKFFKDSLRKIDSGKLIKILDIGGTEIYWERMNFGNQEHIHVTLLNLELENVKLKNFSSIQGDACNLSNFKDDEFDLVFSNSVIEHLFTAQNQKKMADEVRRVGKSYFIQTPNLYFPIEPHWLFPFFQFLPFEIRVFLTNNFNLGNYSKANNKELAIKRVNEVKLLTKEEMKSLFPEGEVYVERFLGLNKSITMYYLVQ